MSKSISQCTMYVSIVCDVGAAKAWEDDDCLDLYRKDLRHNGSFAAIELQASDEDDLEDTKVDERGLMV
jgi:hypothetical protein